MGYKRDFNEIKQQVKYLNERFGFKGLLHFTDFTNLKTIFEQGYLYSRYYCENNIKSFVDGANHEVLNLADEDVHKAVRFYYRGKSPTLYNNEGIKLKEHCNQIHLPIPVYLLFDEELIYLDNTKFTNGNATNSEKGNSALFFKNMDWDAIFHQTYVEPEERSFIVNRRQAELLSEDPVPLSYLKEIIFRCEADRKRAINLFGNDSRYKVDLSLFSDKNFNEAHKECEKNNFISDYKIEYVYDINQNKTALLLKVKYQKPWKYYNTIFKIMDINGLNITEFRKNITYKTKFGTIIKESIDNNEIKILKLEGEPLKWFKLEVYVNEILCIEEFLVKDDIESYNIYFVNDKNKRKLVLNRKFRNHNFTLYSHRYEIFNMHNELIQGGTINFEQGNRGLNWNLTFNNYDESWFKIKYYMDNALCISDEIKSLPF